MSVQGKLGGGSEFDDLEEVDSSDGIPVTYNGEEVGHIISIQENLFTMEIDDTGISEKIQNRFITDVSMNYETVDQEGDHRVIKGPVKLDLIAFNQRKDYC